MAVFMTGSNSVRQLFDAHGRRCYHHGPGSVEEQEKIWETPDSCEPGSNIRGSPTNFV